MWAFLVQSRQRYQQKDRRADIQRYELVIVTYVRYWNIVSFCLVVCFAAEAIDLPFLNRP